MRRPTAQRRQRPSKQIFRSISGIFHYGDTSINALACAFEKALAWSDGADMADDMKDLIEESENKTEGLDIREI